MDHTRLIVRVMFVAAFGLLPVRPALAQDQDTDPSDTQTPDGDPHEGANEAEAGAESPATIASEGGVSEGGNASEAETEGSEPQGTEGDSVAAAGADEPSAAPDTLDQIFANLDHTGTPLAPHFDASSDDGEELVGTGEWNENYDGRGSPPLRPEDALVWIPRTLLLPLHLVLEYLVRVPLTAFVTWAEENHLFERMVDFFTFPDDAGFVFPSVFFISGRGVQFGLNASLTDVGTEGHNIGINGSYGTGGFFNVSLTDQWMVFDNDVGTLTFGAQFGEDPTWAFYGIGPDQPIENEVFYGIRRGEVTADLDIRLVELNRIRFNLAWKNVQFMGGQDVSIDDVGSPFRDAVQAGEFVGFDNPYNLFTLGTGFVIDTRSADREVTAGTGFRLEGFGSFNFTVGDLDLRFFRYGLQPSIFIDLSGDNNVLKFSGTFEAVSEINSAQVPLSEFVTIGGNNIMRAFLPGRSQGESVFALQVEYTWPILFFLDGVVFWEIGNAYDDFYENFAFDGMLTDLGFGFRTSMSRDTAVDVLFAWGSNPIREWNDEFDFESFRFIFGIANFQGGGGQGQ